MTNDGAGADGRRRRAAPIVAAVAAAAALLAIAGAWLLEAGPRAGNSSLIGGPFALQDGNGRTVTSDSLRGKPFLVYFGYTHCPDVCPTELARMADALAKMGDKAIPGLFVTVDPERDTPKVMQDYASSFGPAIVGLSGSPQAIGAMEKAYRVYSRKGQAQPDGSYSMDHSSIVYLMDKSGGFVAPLDLDRPPEEVAKELARYL
ncbi:MAG: SCO family protein [Caulobacteraceae bacterium]|nr:SCO family protein [Caulobacteraceae bacterium]